ncbi:lipopolysaccharide biosynthesis protein [Pseudonocardia alni]|uniref:Oligosaccharide flippase family protein n=1 Tax=Pseudonocardia alni subsp. carboxydivorans TaxID=415010 RepID=A0ABU9ALF8_PSEA5
MIRLRGSAWMAATSAAQVSSAIVGLATNIVYARFLELADIGTIALANSVSIMVAIFADRGLGLEITRQMSREQLPARHAFRIYQVSGSIVLLPVIAGLCLADSIVVRDSLRDVNVFVFSALLAAGLFQYQSGLALVQGSNLPYHRAAGISGNATLTLGLTVGALYLGLGVAGAILSSALAFALAGGWLSWCSTRRTQEISSSTYSKPMRLQALRRGRRMYGTNLIVYLVATGDVLLASVITSPATVGQYQIVRKIAQGVTMPMIVLLPMLLGKLSGPGVRDKVHRSVQLCAYLSVLVSAVVLASVVALDWPIELVFGTDYAGLGIACGVLLGGLFLQFVKDLLATIANAADADNLPLLANLTVLVGVIGAFPLLPPMTLSGFVFVPVTYFAAGATLMAFLLAWRRVLPAAAIIRVGGCVAIVALAIVATSLAGWIAQ